MKALVPGIVVATLLAQGAGAQYVQQGAMLVGGGVEETPSSSVALSADGNTALVGGSASTDGIRAVWVFTRSDGEWLQRGSELVGTGGVGSAGEGAVALSADGNTALVGGPGDNNRTGAAWVFTRSGDAWTQQGGKLVGTGAVGAAGQGIAVALSADGNTALVGGPGTTTTPAPCGSLPARTGCGRNRVASSSAPAT